jgi:hypothetical protein
MFTGMRTETEIVSDIKTLSGEVENLQSVAPPLSGVSLTLQNLRQELTDAYRELLDLKSPGTLPTTPEPTPEPEPALAAAGTEPAPAGGGWKPAWKKKK